MPTKTETRTDEKRKQNAADRKREQARQELRVERDRALAKLATEQQERVAQLHAEFRGKRLKVWDTFRSGMQKLRRPQ